MSLAYAILGFLNYGPSTGYDLKKVFDQSVNHFWSADQSQIYRTLSRLAENGLTNIQVIRQDDAPDRKVYHITETGRRRLMDWLATGSPPASMHSSELIQVFFAGQLSNDQALEMFRRALKYYRELLAAYHQIRQESWHEHPHDPITGQQARHIFFWQLTLENGIVTTEALVSWIESVIERLEKEDYRVFPLHSTR